MMTSEITNYKALSFETEYAKEPIVLEDEDTSNPVLRQVLSDLFSCQEEYGSDHSKVAEAWNALGLIRIHMQHDAAAAKECHEQALRIYRVNIQTSDIAVTLNDLGYCFEQLSQPEMAMKNYQEALLLLKELDLPDNNPRFLSVNRAVSRLSRG